MKAKKTAVFLFAMCYVSLIHANVENPVVNGSEKAINENETITAYFSSYLTGKVSTFNQSKKIKLGDTETVRKKVWTAWQEANRCFTEEKLITLLPLANGKSGQWHLPANLEPDAVMSYYWGTKGESPSSGYPFYLYLHGSGPKTMEWQIGLTICNNFQDAPSVYFIPQIPNEGEYYRWWQRSKQFAWEKLLRQALVSGQVDPDRIYMFGISEGGYGSQRLCSFYADYLAAAGPMAGGEPLKNAPAENCRNIAFSLRTGEKDMGFYRNILTRYIKAEFDSLQTYNPDGFKHWVELVPAMGHAIDYSSTPLWLKKHIRNPYPKQVSWEDFEMDGKHRKGFYNIYVDKRPEGAERTYYEMKIDGNTINLTVQAVNYEVIQKDPRWGIEMKFKKCYTSAGGGRLTLYLCDELVDLSKPIILRVNGKKVFVGKVKPDLKHLVNSCTAFFDPRRIYPAAVEIVY